MAGGYGPPLQPATMVQSGGAGPKESIRLPAEEFSYIGRPAETFEGRWTAIEEAFSVRFGGRPFSLVDLGSNHGYFSLNASLRFPQAQVVGVEGSVGVGNGAVGSSTRSASRIVATEAIRKHLDWIAQLSLQNCFVAPEVWDLDHVEKMCEASVRVDAMLELSVVHHIDGICQSQYSRRGLSRVQGSLALFAGIIRLADVHVLELPDKPWLDHLFAEFGTPRGIIDAVLALTGEEWNLRMIHRNDWMGVRELWLLESRKTVVSATPHGAILRSIFPVLLPGDDLVVEEEPLLAASHSCSPTNYCTVQLPGDEAFVTKLVCGRWRNAFGTVIEVSGRSPKLQCVYEPGVDPEGLPKSGESRTMDWEEGIWNLKTAAGHFTLQEATGARLAWRVVSGGWTTEWHRV